MFELHGTDSTRLVARWSLVVNLLCLTLLVGLYCYPSFQFRLTAPGDAQHVRQHPLLGATSSAVEHQPSPSPGSTAAQVGPAPEVSGIASQMLASSPTNAAPLAGSPTYAEQEQQRQQQQQQPEPRWYKPHGYMLPQECEKHEDLYLSIVDNLRPWMKRGGITKMDIEGCGVPIALNTSVNGTPSVEQFHNVQPSAHFRFVILDNIVHISSGGLRRGKAGYQPLELHIVTQIQMAATRFGLPDTEFVIGWWDISWIDKESKNGGLCPLMVYCKFAEHFDILLPNGHFIEYPYDDWLTKTKTTDPGDVPWEAKEERVIGRFNTYSSFFPPKDRYGVTYDNPRLVYENYSRDANGTLTDFYGTGSGLSDQRRFKYTMNLDGIGCSTRFQKLLATGQTVVKQETQMKEFYHDALTPWVHYAPTGFNGLTEIEGVAQFLRDHDEMARSMGQNSQQFAHKHLNEEGRLCYIKVLFEEMERLKRYQPKREDFPYLVTWEEEVDRHFSEDEKAVFNVRREIL